MRQIAAWIEQALAHASDKGALERTPLTGTVAADVSRTVPVMVSGSLRTS